MKKTLAALMVLILCIGSVAHAAPDWLSEETIETLSSIPGFVYEYDIMEDRMRVMPASLLECTHQDGLLFPSIESYETDLFFSIEFASKSKIQESITGAIFLVGNTRYYIEIPPEYQEAGSAYTDIGKTGASMITDILRSALPVKVRLQYKSGNVDFEMSDYQVNAFGKLFAAYQSIGGMEQSVIPGIDIVYPITVK